MGLFVDENVFYITSVLKRVLKRVLKWAGLENAGFLGNGFYESLANQWPVPPSLTRTVGMNKRGPLIGNDS